ncbi:MAG TPA: hypothetical protein VGG72_35400 [Bryobacteraceae bacterium]
MISDLRAERDALTAAMTVLEGIAQSRGRRRGRPPAWLASLPGAKKKDAPTRTVSPATKKKMALAQRRRWAAVKKGQEVAAQAEA